jgi:signal transduction histidine kinase
LNRALTHVEKYIKSEGNRLALIAHTTLNDDSLKGLDYEASRREALKIRKSQGVDFVCVCNGSRVKGDPDIGFPNKKERLLQSFGVTTVIHREEKLPALVGVYRHGQWTGVAGKLISTSFLEDMEELTGMEVAVWLREGRKWGVPNNLSDTEKHRIEKWLKRVTRKGIPLYDEDMEMGGQEYKTVFVPMRSWRGEPLGMLMFSLSDKQTFESLLVSNRYFALIMGLGVLLSVILGWWVAGRISQPVQKFATSANAIAQGDYSLEVPLTQRQDEIGDLARAFERMRQGLREAQRREKLASLGELSAGLAHEIRNPLGIIKNAAEGLVNKERGQKEKDLLLEIIIKESRRLNKLVSDFLTFARPTPPKKEEGSLKELAEEVAFSIKDEMKEKGITLRLELNKVLLPFDRDQIRQVLLNLFLNALDATPEGGEIGVSLLKEDQEVCLRLRDTGGGIPREHVDKIFDPFFTTKEKGTGLGLALVYRIVEEHGGTARVESREGEGTMVEIRLPVIKGNTLC